jgi:hypothetical protein
MDLMNKVDECNNITNLYCRTAKKGCAEKETMMVVEGTRKGGFNFH